MCRSVPLAEIAQHGHVLTPGRYVGAEEVEDNDEDFAIKIGLGLAPFSRTHLTFLGWADL